MYYGELLKALADKKVRYLLVGGAAVSLHGIPRSTADLDIMIDLTRANIKRFIEAVSGIPLVPRAPVSLEDMLDPARRKAWAEEKNMVVLSFHNPARPYEELDVLIENHLDFKAAYKNRVMMSAGGILLPVASIDDLIAMKTIPGRKQDGSDIAALKKLKGIT